MTQSAVGHQASVHVTLGRPAIDAAHIAPAGNSPARPTKWRLRSAAECTPCSAPWSWGDNGPRRILDELNPRLPEPSSAIGEVRMTAEASGSGRVYQAGRDQHITER